MKIWKRIASWVLALVLVLGMVPMVSLRAYADYTTNMNPFRLSVTVKHNECGTYGDIHTVNRVSYSKSGTTYTYEIKTKLICYTCYQTYTLTTSDIAVKCNDCEQGTAATTVTKNEDGFTISFKFWRDATEHASSAITTVPATCTAPGEKSVKNCYYCGLTKTLETYPIDPDNHKAASAWTRENGQHYKICANGCGAQLEKATCTYSDANCTAPATCSVCSGTSGNTIEDAHIWGAWTSNGDGTHYRTCTLNNSHKENGVCSGDANANCTASGTCTTCGGSYINAEAHSYTYAASGSTITETCANGCSHNATAKLEYAAGNGIYSYTGSAIEPLEVAYSNGWQGSTLPITYSANHTDVGTAKGVITKNGKAAELTYEIKEADITEAEVTLNPASGSFNGTEQKPAVSVVWKNMPLVEGIHYNTVSWDKTGFTDADTYTATIQGKGNFKGTVTKAFTINTANITGAVNIFSPIFGDRTLYAVYSGSETVAYQWYCDGNAISGATGNTYTPTYDDIGKVLRWSSAARAITAARSQQNMILSPICGMLLWKFPAPALFTTDSSSGPPLP